jgi:uncharacterized protein (TIGR02001 family)
MAKGSNDGKTIFRCKLVLIAVTGAACQAYTVAAPASEFSGIATLTSEYIYRGRAMSSGDPAIQLGLDYEHDSGFFVGLWGSSIDLRNRFGERDTEVDFYAGYHFALQAPILFSASLLRYTYPGQTGAHSYDYNEALVAATLYEHYSVELGYTSDLYGLGEVGRHWELRTEWPVAGAWVVSAGLGQVDRTSLGVERYLFWDAGASARFAWLTVDLRYFDNERPDTLAADVSADSQVVLSLSVAF